MLISGKSDLTMRGLYVERMNTFMLLITVSGCCERYLIHIDFLRTDLGMVETKRPARSCPTEVELDARLEITAS